MNVINHIISFARVTIRALLEVHADEICSFEISFQHCTMTCLWQIILQQRRSRNFQENTCCVVCAEYRKQELCPKDISHAQQVSYYSTSYESLNFKTLHPHQELSNRSCSLQLAFASLSVVLLYVKLSCLPSNDRQSNTLFCCLALC